MTENGQQVTLTVSCLCAAFTFTTKTPSASLPLNAGCCHCDSCRRLTGNLYSICAPWPGVTPDLSELRKYIMSPRISTFSCERCGSTLFCRVAGLKRTYVILGVVDSDRASVVAKYGNHMWVGDTLDGGASGWLAMDPVGGEIKRWREHRGEELGPDWGRDWASAYKNGFAAPEKSLIGCHCRGVALTLRSALDLKGKHPFPECVEPGTFRYRTSMCACDSCRRASGAEVTPWAAVPLSHIQTADGTSFPITIHGLKEAVDQALVGTLTYFKSSKNVKRYRCRVCSAGIFWAVREQPDMVCVAVGVLQNEDGARKERLLAWECKRGVLFKKDVART